MNTPPESPSNGASPSTASPPRRSSADDRPRRTMAELRRLLLRPDRKVVADLKDRVDRLEVEQDDLMADEVSAVLPEAIRQSADDETLAEALSPTIERTLHVSVERDPQPIVDAVFPVIGPAIRKSVSEALNSLVANVNQTLEHGFSAKGLRWRWEAWRTGQSFADVVLRHTLLFRVEQIFLIDRETGLPMQHLTAEAVKAEDSALVSGMLTAIQDFVHDSFELEDEETLQDFSVGNVAVWGDHGPHAALAAVIRGTPDPRMREVMHQVTERVHHQFRDALVAFEGDPETLDEAQPVLENALLTQYEAPSTRPSPTLWIILTVVLAVLGWWSYQSWTAQKQWSAYLSQLDAAPGLVITETGTDDGRWRVEGLRDPLAPDPDSILRTTALRPADVTSTWRPYQALDPEILLRRARTRVEDEVVLFREGTLLQNGQQVVLDRLSTALLDLREAATSVGYRIDVQVRGHHSAEGSRELNRRLATERASFVRQSLRERGVPDAALRPVSAVGVPIDPDLVGTEEGRTFNRGVTLRVDLQPVDGASASAPAPSTETNAPSNSPSTGS